MKQTSLFQSWTKTHPNSSATNHSPGLQSIANCLTPVQSPHLSSCSDSPLDLKINIEDGDEDDLILANLLDNFDATSDVADQLPTSNQIQDHASDYQDPKLLAKLNGRPPISYRPTANDFDHLDGFDETQGHTWIYPTTASFREYQFNIIEQCLYKNTLVCLPTGLGKTFIAAVVMINFLRWYPLGKLIFMAPTRPLVTQQLAACSQFLGLPSNQRDLIELTGSIPQSRRKTLWLRSRVFFLTPQVLANDLQSQICPASHIRLLVFDEAHKATGNHAYCQVLRLLTNPPYTHRQFRILALSATPASDVEGVQLLIANLLISHLELRTDTSADVKPYTQHRQIETIVVHLGPELSRFHTQLVDCIRIPLERLHERGALGTCHGDLRPDRVAKFSIIKAREEWSNRGAQNVTPMENNLIQSDFGLVICLLHALELLVQHGLRPLYRYLEGVYSGQRASASVRSELKKLPRVERLFSDLEARFASLSANPNQHLNSTQTPFQAGHPKLDKLKSILQDHFRNNLGQASNEQHTTRAIVFTQFRDSVEEIMHMLKQMRPLIRPASFIGQSSKVASPTITSALTSGTLQPTSRPLITTGGGISQRDQIRVMDSFRNGTFNTLVSTCVGEEGIDVGQVDLIVCFDAFKSPVRLMQRLGRTGRRRLGRIIILLTEGREQRNLAVSVARTSSIHRALLDGGAYRKLAFYPHNPRMIPLLFQPKLKFDNLSGQLFAKINETNESTHAQKKRENRKSGIDAYLKSHIDAIGLDSLKLRLEPVSPGPLVSVDRSEVSRQDCQPKLLQITQLYDLVSPKCIAAARSCLQASAHIGSSSSSHHLVTVLRLIELNRRDLTTLSYHALGLRSVDSDVRLHEVFDPTSQTSESPKPKHLSPKLDVVNGLDQKKVSDESIVFDAELTKSKCNADKSFDRRVNLPSIVAGLVSDKLIFDPLLCDFDKTNVEYAKSFYECRISDPVHEPITTSSIQHAWNFLIDIIKSSFQQCDKFKKLPSPEIDLKLNIETSLLEVISPELMTSTTPKPNLDKTCDNWNTLAIDQTSICNESKPNLAHAFNIPFLIARSTPYAKAHHSSRNITHQTSQVNLDEALAMLEQSTVQLDVSCLMNSQDDVDEKVVANNQSCSKTQSVLFNGPICPFVPTTLANHSSADTLLFGTKLLVGQDFEDLFLPTQPIPKDVIHDRQDSSNSSGGLFSSQISWSPISVEQEHASPTQSPIPTLITSSPIKSPVLSTSSKDFGNFTLDPTTEYQIVSSRIEHDNTNTLTIQSDYKIHHSLSSNTHSNNEIVARRTPSSKKSQKKTNKLFLSQAHCSELDSTNLGEDPNQYDSSFIDDDQGTQSVECSSDSDDSPDMTAVYLQTARSPSLPFANQRPKLLVRRSLGYAINKNSVESRLGSGLSSWNPPKKSARHGPESDSPKFIFSQVPEQDEDYELDSFCVEDVSESPKKPTRYGAKKRRCRITTSSSESEDH